MALDDLERAVGRAAVDHDVLNLSPVLGAHRGERVAYRVAPVEAGGDDADFQACCSYHWYAARNPSFGLVFAVQPRARSRDTSTTLRGMPSGLEVSYSYVPLQPATSATRSASSRMVMSSPVPTLTCISPE